MTRSYTHAPAPSAGGGPRLSAAHQTRDARTAANPSRASLDRLLLALSVPRPVSHDLVDTALVRLRETAGSLEVCTDALLTRSGMFAAAVGLRTGIAFVLDHWICEHRGLDAHTWDTAHAEALTADLTEIARTVTTSRIEAGRTVYQIAFDIDTAAYCGRPVPVEADRGRAVGEPEHQRSTLSRFRIPVCYEGMNHDYS